MSVEIPIGFGLCRYQWQLQGSPKIINCTIGFSVGSSTTALQCAQQMDTDFLSTVGLAANLTIGYNILPTQVTVNFTGGPPETAEAGLAVPTTANAPAMPPQVALLGRKNTAPGGRKFKGRRYLPACFMQEALVSATGALDAAAQAVIQTRLSAFQAAVSARSRSLYLLHSPQTPSLLPTVIASLTLQPLVATQRDRLR